MVEVDFQLQFEFLHPHPINTFKALSDKLVTDLANQENYTSCLRVVLSLCLWSLSCCTVLKNKDITNS